jgi:hypothetical protein
MISNPHSFESGPNAETDCHANRSASDKFLQVFRVARPLNCDFGTFDFTEVVRRQFDGILLRFVASTNHAVTYGLKQLNLLDEPYWPMVGDTNRIEVLAVADVDGEARPLVWTFQQGKSRVFASIPGHYDWTFDDPLFRILALRGVAWAAGEPVGRLVSTASSRTRR